MNPAEQATPEVVAVVPCLNEAAAIGRVVREVRAFVSAVLVVDDGSTDATAAEARAAGAEVLRHSSAQGKGAALTGGLALALERGYGWALLLDGDGQHAPADIPKFLAVAADPSRRASLVVGNRMERPDAMPRVRRWVNRWMSRRLSRLAGRALPDTQCGFRLMRLADWSRLRVELRTQNFEVESEMLLSFVRAGLEVTFVPIQIIYKEEQSKIHPVRDTVRWFRWLRSVQ